MSRPTLAGVICVSGLWRRPLYSPEYVSQRDGFARPARMSWLVIDGGAPLCATSETRMHGASNVISRACRGVAPIAASSRPSVACAAERTQKSNEVVELALGQLVRPEVRHERSRLLDDLPQRRLDVALKAILGVHNLDRKCVVAFRDAADPAPVGRHKRDRCVAGRDRRAGVPDVADQRLARAARSDSREIGAEVASTAPDAMTASTSAPEQAFAGLRITGGGRRRHAWRERPQIGEDRPDFLVRNAAGRHRAALDAAAHGFKDAFTCQAGSPQHGQIGTKDSFCVDAVTLGTRQLKAR